jgi:hypothetical protein
MTPVFSFLLSRLLFEVSSGAHNVSTINFFGGIVLGIAALDGLLVGLKWKPQAMPGFCASGDKGLPTSWIKIKSGSIKGECRCEGGTDVDVSEGH